MLFAVGATARWARDGIHANALMPGGIATNLQRHMDPGYIDRVVSAGEITLKTPEQGAATSVYVATAPALEGVGGRYYEDCAESPVVDRAREPGRRALRAGRRQRRPAVGALGGSGGAPRQGGIRITPPGDV